MSKPCVLVVGNLSDGFRFIGPFADFDEAAQFGEGVDADSWVATLEMPDDCPSPSLIAAAPELLAALREARDTLIELYEYAYPGDESDNDVTQTIDMAIAAIAKAEGGAS